jgi:hypothetical protein
MNKQEMIEQRARYLYAELIATRNVIGWVEWEKIAKPNKVKYISQATADVEWFQSHLPTPSREELREKIAMIIAHGAGVKLSPLDMSYTVWSNYLKQADSILSLIQPASRDAIIDALHGCFSDNQRADSILSLIPQAIPANREKIALEYEKLTCAECGNGACENKRKFAHILVCLVTKLQGERVANAILSLIQPVEVVLPENPYNPELQDISYGFYNQCLADIKKLNPNVKFREGK